MQRVERAAEGCSGVRASRREIGGHAGTEPNVFFWHFSDIQPALTNVRFWGQSGHPEPFIDVR